MSKQVDSRVVEMRFDNAQFENNVKTTMSTLDRLKESLHFKGAEKGFDNLSSASKKVDMTHLEKGIETVKVKFSALQVIGVTALANITNSVVNAGKNIVKSLTIAPISDGWQEYEMTLNAVQTTMAGTGKTAEEVEQQLKKLDEYADKTVYSTADMLNNLPKFTNAGVELESATTAMIGIANATALAGGDASKASIAFYNLGQAIGTGYLSRMDYNSINNAGIATMEWKNQMVEAAIAQGTLTRVGEDSFKAGKKTYTLQQLFIDGLKEQWATTDVMMKVFGDYGNETTEIGKKAYDSAQNIKTFSQMMESLKATAGTGWKDTWQLIFGGLDEATKFWTGLSEFISGIITSMADFRNTLLEGALGKTFSNLSKKLDGLLGPAKSAAKTVKNVTDTVKDLGDIVDRVISGEFGNAPTRFQDLAKAGYNWAEVQNKVNERLGCSFRYTENLTEAQKEGNKQTEEATKSTEKLTQKDAEFLAQLTEMSDAQLKNAGYTKEQIKAIRELEREANKLGMPVAEFINQIDELNGRTILINSFKNIGKGLVTVFTSLKDAWTDIFPPATAEQLYNVIAGFHKLTTYLVPSEATADKLTRTFKGLFAALDIILTVIGGPIKIAFKIFTQLLSVFDLDILDVTAAIGDAIVGFRDWIDSVLDFTKIFEKIQPYLTKFVDTIKKWVGNIKEAIADLIPNIGNALSNLPEKIVNLFGKLKSLMPPVASDILAGLANGIANGAKTVWNAIVNLGKNILDWFCGVLGIHSPSKETYAIGINVVQGFANGIGDSASGLFGIVKDLCSKVINSITNANWSDIKNVLTLVAAFFSKIPGLKQITALATYFSNIGADTMQGLFNGIQNGAGSIFGFISSVATNLVDTFKSILGIASPSKVFFAIGGFLIAGLIAGISSDAGGVFESFKGIGKNLINIAKDIVLGIIDFIKSMSVGEVIVIAFTAGIVAAVVKVIKVVNDFKSILGNFGKAAKGAGDLMTALANKMNPKENKFDNTANTLLKLAGVLAILAAVAKLFASMSWGDMGKAAAGIGGLIVFMGILMLITKIGNFKKVGSMLLKMAGVMVLLLLISKMMSRMDWGNLGKAAVGIGGLIALMALLMLVTKIGNFKKVGSMLLKMSMAIGLLVLIGKSIAKMSWGDMGKAAVGLSGMIGFLALLMLVTKIGNFKKVGSMLLVMSVAIMILVRVGKSIAKMSWGDMGKAAAGLSGLIGFMALLMLVTKIGNFKKVGSMLLAMSGAMALLAVTAKIVASMSWGDMAKAAVGLSGLVGIMALLMLATKIGGKNIKGAAGTLIAMSAAIAILAGVCVILGLVDVARLAQGVIAVGILMVLMKGLLTASKNAKDAKGGIMAIAITLGIMAAAIAGLSFISTEKLASAVTALGIIMFMFTLMEKNAGKTKNSMAAMLSMAAVIAVMGGMLYLISTLPAEQTVPAAIALSGTMLALSAVMKIISKIKIDKGKIMSTLLTMVAMCALFVAFGFALSTLPNLSGKEASIITIGATMLAMSGVLAIISKIKVNKNAWSAIGGLTALCALLVLFGHGISTLPDLSGKETAILTIAATMTAMTALLAVLTLIGAMSTALGGGMFAGVLGLTTLCALLVAFGLGLSLVPNLNDKIPTIMALTQVMTVLTALLAVLSIVGVLYTATAGLAATGILGLAAMMGLMVIFGAALSLVPDLTPNMPTIMSLVSIMSVLTDLCMKLAIVGPLAIIGVTALGLLEGLMIATGAFAVAVGALMEKFPALQSFLNTGITVMIQIADGLGQMIGAFIGGTIEQISSTLPGLGVSLGLFMTGAQPFIDGMNRIDAGTLLKNVSALTAAILELTVADFIDGINKFIGGGTSFAQLGAELSAFAVNAMPFFTTISFVNPETLASVKTLAEAVKIMTTTDLIEGINAFGGESKLANFGAELAAFAPHIKTFSDETKDIKPETVKPAAEAAKLLAEMAAALPNSGGALGFFAGENDMDTFGSQLKSFGSALKDYCAEVDGIKTTSVKPSVDAAKLIIDMADLLPNSGGLLSVFTGDNTLKGFGTNLKAFGTALKDYCGAVEGITTGSVGPSIDAAKKLIDMADLIPESGGIFSVFTKNKSMKKFGKQLKSFGEALKDYSDSVADVNSEQISSSVSAANSTIKLVKSLEGFEVPDLTSFETASGNIASALVTYSDSATSVDSEAVTSAIGVAKNTVTFIKSLNGLSSEGVGVFKQAVTSLATVSLNSLAQAFNGSANTLRSIGSNIVKGLAEGVVSKAPALVVALNTTLLSAISSISVQTSVLYSAGSSMIINMVNGVKAQAASLNSAVSSAISNANSSAKAKAVTMASIGVTIMTSMANGAKSKASSLIAVVNATILQALTAIQSRVTLFGKAGMLLMSSFDIGIKLKSLMVIATVSSMMSSALSEITGDYWDWVNAGEYIVDGLKKGIDDNKSKAINAAAKMAAEAYAAALEELGVKSPSKAFAEAGMYSAMGLAKGMLDNMRTSNSAAVALSAGVVESMCSYLGIHSPAKLVKNKVGKYIVQGLAEGIKSDMTAEEKAEQKANNIVDAFTKALDDVDLTIGILDAEYNLWDTLHKNTATEGIKLIKEYELLSDKLGHIDWKIKLAQDEYDFTKKTFGEASKYAKEAYTKLVDLKTQLADIRNQMSENIKAQKDYEYGLTVKQIEASDDLADKQLEGIELEHELWAAMNDATASEVDKLANQASLLEKKIANKYTDISIAESLYQKAIENGESAETLQDYYNNILKGKVDLAKLINESSTASKDMDTAIRELEYNQKEAFKKYTQYLAESYDIMREYGMSHEEIQELARKYSGYDPDAVRNAKETAKGITTATSGLITTVEGVGTAVSQTISSAMQSGTSEVVKTTADAITNCTESINTQQWYDAGVQCAQSLANGIKDQASLIRDAVLNCLQDAIAQVGQSMSNGFGVNGSISPVLDANVMHNRLSQTSQILSRTAALASANSASFERHYSMMTDIANKVDNATNENKRIVKAISELRGDFGELIDAINDIDIRLDSGTVVGEIVNKIDNKLGQIASHKGRGN